MSRALGEAALVEFGEIDGRLHAIVFAGGRWHHRRLGATADVTRELGHVRLALRRMAYGEAHAALAAGAQEQLVQASAALDRLLFGPIAKMLGRRPVVVVPTGELFSAPWGVLPTLVGRAVSVAPSSQLWLEATSKARRSTRRAGERSANRRTVVVAGPGLAGAEREVAKIGSLYPMAQVLGGAAGQRNGCIGGVGRSRPGSYRRPRPLSGGQWPLVEPRIGRRCPHRLRPGTPAPPAPSRDPLCMSVGAIGGTRGRRNRRSGRRLVDHGGSRRRGLRRPRRRQGQRRPHGRSARAAQEWPTTGPGLSRRPGRLAHRGRPFVRLLRRSVTAPLWADRLADLREIRPARLRSGPL